MIIQPRIEIKKSQFVTLVVLMLLILGSIIFAFAGTVYIDNGVLNLTSDMYVSKAIEGSFKGYIKGAYPIYDSTTSVNITTGNGECNGNYFKIDSVIEHTMTSLAAGEDFHYIYIDDSASVYPIPTIIDSTTEPVWSDSLQGWYNGDDRVIGVVWSPDASSTISSFTHYSDESYSLPTATVISNQQPDGAWAIAEATSYTPVNTNSIFIHAQNYGGDPVYVGIDLDGCSFYKAAHGASYGYVIDWFKVSRDCSRDVKWIGEANDGSSFNIYIKGYRIER